jgi:hypothetical protein
LLLPVTILSAAIILAFMTIEFFDYRRVTIDTSISVDKSRGEKLTVKLNVTFPRVPCYREWSRDDLIHVPPHGERPSLCAIPAVSTDPSSVLSLDVMDISGELQRDISHNVVKTRLNPRGEEIPNTRNYELKNELEILHEPKGADHCGSCYGGHAPESGCCQTCEEVRQAYLDNGWSFSNPDGIEQVCRLALLPTAYKFCPYHWASAFGKAGQRN